ncbi:hypothetical protein U1737_07055 [Sphingomonas sp. LB3N6]|uniref:hypothetical protein n=1 Tax=Sphingomonas fucosidasi TaxID=3096164 RepID=UPI002FCB7B72
MIQMNGTRQGEGLGRSLDRDRFQAKASKQVRRQSADWAAADDGNVKIYVFIHCLGQAIPPRRLASLTWEWAS